MIKFNKRSSIFILAYLFWMIGIAPFFATERPLIAVIKSRDIALYNIALEGFNKALKDKGIYANLVQYDIKASKEEGYKVAAQIKLRKPELILTLGSQATKIAKESIEDIPVVFSMVLNPVDSGLVDSMQSSGNNLTGVSMDIPIRDQFENLKMVVPRRVKRIGVLYNPKETGAVVAQALKVAKEMGLELIVKPVNSKKDVPEALKELCRRIDVLWSVADSTVFSPQSTRFIILHTLRNRIPFMGLSPSYVKAGALLALSWDYEDIGRQSGEIAAKVLAGKKPADLPIAAPRKIFLLLNLRTAEQIGIKIPPDVINRAKEVIR